MLAEIELSYNEWHAIQKLPPEKYAELRAALPRLEFPEDQTAYWHHAPIVADADDLAALERAGVKAILSRVRGLRYPEHPAVSQAATTLIATTGVGLFQVTRVEVREDYCTEELQRDLDDGWRVIAVCPPNDARRPTYVLGRVE